MRALASGATTPTFQSNDFVSLFYFLQNKPKVVKVQAAVIAVKHKQVMNYVGVDLSQHVW
jgi:hypothetical protein